MDKNSNTILVVGNNDYIDLTKLNIIKLLPCTGGKLIIRELPIFPPVCCFNIGCDDIADYVATTISSDGAVHITCLCKDHKDNLLQPQTSIDYVMQVH